MDFNTQILEAMTKETQAEYNRKVASKLASTYNAFSGDDNLYGKVDTNYNSIILKKRTDNLVALAPNVYVLGFVADAFGDLMNHIQETRALAPSRLPDRYSHNDGSTRNSFLSSLSVQQNSFIEPHKLYYDMLDDVYEYFSTGYIKFHNRDKMIKNVDHFVKAFVKFSLGEFLPEYFAMTHSGFVRRNIFSIDSTGLSIHLQDDRTMDLAELARKYGQDPNLVFFANACLKHGFMINSYSPTSIIADLASPKMREYMKKRNCYMGADILERTGTTLAGGLGHKHTYAFDSNGDGRTLATIDAPHHVHDILGYEVKHVSAEPQTGAHVHGHEMPRQEMFLKHYDRTCNYDIDFIKKQIFIMYNSFVDLYPFNDTFKINSEYEKVHTGHYRKKISENEFMNKYPDKYWLEYYLKLRLKEERLSITNQAYSKVWKKAMDASLTGNYMLGASAINKELVKRLHYVTQARKKEYTY